MIVPVTPGDLVVDTLEADLTSVVVTANGGQTGQWNLVGAQTGAGSTKPGASSVTMGWSFSASALWQLGAVPVHATAADAGSDAGIDGGQDAGADASTDAGDGGPFDAGADAGSPDAGDGGPFDAGTDAGSSDAGDGGPFDAGADAGADAGSSDAGDDGGVGGAVALTLGCACDTGAQPLCAVLFALALAARGLRRR